jgi:hypothetical protein
MADRTITRAEEASYEESALSAGEDYESGFIDPRSDADMAPLIEPPEPVIHSDASVSVDNAVQEDSDDEVEDVFDFMKDNGPEDQDDPLDHLTSGNPAFELPESQKDLDREAGEEGYPFDGKRGPEPETTDHLYDLKDQNTNASKPITDKNIWDNAKASIAASQPEPEEPSVVDDADQDDEPSSSAPGGAKSGAADRSNEELQEDSEQSDGSLSQIPANNTPAPPPSPAHVGGKSNSQQPPKEGQEPTAPPSLGGGLAALSSVPIRMIGGAARGAGKATAVTAGVAGMATAKGAQWGWETNKQQRASYHAKRAAASIAKMKGLDSRIANGMKKIEGTAYSDHAKHYAEIAAKPSKTEWDVQRMSALKKDMKTELQSNPDVRSAVSDMAGCVKDARRAASAAEAHVRRGTLDEDKARGDILNPAESAMQKLGTEGEGMVSENGNTLAEAAKEMSKRIAELIDRILASIGLKGSQKQEMA